MSESITGKDRIEAAIRLEALDRVPVAPLAMYFCARFNGISTKEFLNDAEKQVWATEKTFERLGGWDGWYFAAGSITAKGLKTRWPLRVKLPGDGLPDDAPLPQLFEEQVMTVEDYDAILEMGYGEWFNSYIQRLYPEMNVKAVLSEEVPRVLANLGRFHQKWEVERKIPLLAGVSIYQPIEVFSFARSFYEFSLDMARRPEKILAAVEAAYEPMVSRGIKACKAAGTKAAWVGGWRTGASFISPRQYKKFVEPWLKRMCDDLIAEGITPVLHFDADWNPLLPFLRELPAKKCIFAPDQQTDLVKAKEILGDHMCLMGNVSPQVLALGTVDETVAECKRLIDLVGKGGGFILSSGCELPFNTKPENFAAMLDTARTYGVYR